MNFMVSHNTQQIAICQIELLNGIIAERISNRQIIVQQVWRYSRVLVCMYEYMSAKNSELSIVHGFSEI